LELVIRESQRAFKKQKTPNKACSGFVGVCAIYKQFSGFGFFLLPTIDTVGELPSSGDKVAGL